MSLSANNSPSKGGAPKNKAHWFSATCVFEATGQASDALSRNYGWVSMSSDISCAGVTGGNMLSHPVLLTSYSGLADSLQIGQMYMITAKVISGNNNSPDHFFHESAHKVLFGPAGSFAGNLIDNTATHSIGVVVNKSLIQEEGLGGKTTVVAIVRHTDYDPIARASVEFFVEYRIRPVRNLGRSEGMIQLGRETTFRGFIVDWNAETKMWIVDVYTIGPCSGNEIITGHTNAETNNTITVGGRVRLPQRGEAAHTPVHPGAGIASGSGTTLPISESTPGSQASPQTPTDSSMQDASSSANLVEVGVPASSTRGPIEEDDDDHYLQTLAARNSQGPSKRPKKK